MEWWPNKSRIGPQLPESAYITCKSGGYLSVSGGQLALVMAKVTTTNHCGQNTDCVQISYLLSSFLPISIIIILHTFSFRTPLQVRQVTVSHIPESSLTESAAPESGLLIYNPLDCVYKLFSPLLIEPSIVCCVG